MVLRVKQKRAEEGSVLRPAASSGKSRRAVKRKGAEDEAETGGAGAGTKDRPKRSNKNGADLLKKAADRELVKIAETVAVRLKEKALLGDVTSVKTLVGFSEQRKSTEKPKKSGSNLAFIEELASEAQWEGPMEEEEHLWRDCTDRWSEKNSGQWSVNSGQGTGDSGQWTGIRSGKDSGL